jgi:cytochrome c peroxidase
MSMERRQFAASSRLLHWTMAAMVLTMLGIGVTMVASLANYHLLVSIHRPLGIAILILVVIRFVNRQLHTMPPFPTTMARAERLAATASEYTMYGLMFVLPLVGWGMLSAARYPIVLYGSLHLPFILPHDLMMHAVLRKAHTILAYLFFLTVLAHFGAILFHTLIVRDGMLMRMAPWNIKSVPRPARTGPGLSVMLAVTVPLLLLGCGGELADGEAARDTATKAIMTQGAAKAPPIPRAGALARPRNLRQVGLPLELTRTVIPSDNRQTPEKVALGQKLFFDGRLSADGTVACATCHDPARAFTDGRPLSIGIDGRVGQRNAPTILNALYNKAQFWDGRVKTLEEQAALPIVNPFEMGQPTLDAAVARIGGIEEYRQAFQRAFGRPVKGPDLLGAIAAYERTLVSFDSPFDHFIAGDKNAVDDAGKRGWELFNTKARCNKCHALTDSKRDVTNFTDYDYHNIGIGIIKHNVVALARKAQREVAAGHLEAIDRAAIQTDMSVLGRYLLTKKTADTAAFRTPNLRNVLVTGPYFHDGSQETLWDVCDHYNKGDGLKNPWLDEDIQPLALTERDIDDLVALMASLTSSEYRELGNQELERQRALSRTSRPQRDTKRAFGPRPPRPAPPPP